MAIISVEIGGYSVRAMLKTQNGTMPIELGNSAGNKVIPSSIAKEINGKIHVGDEAIIWKYNSEFMSVTEIENDELTYTKTIYVLSEMLIQKAHGMTKEEIIKIIYVVPNYYSKNDPRRSFIKNALNKLGIYNVDFVTVHEAICSRQAYISPNQYVMLFDMGHLGLNASVLKRVDSCYETVSTKRLELIGGQVFNGIIYRDIMKKCDPVIPEDIQYHALLNEKLENISIYIKEHLSSNEKYECPIPCSDKIYSITRKEFENELSSVIGGGFNACQNMVSENNINSEDIVEAIICGGSCRIPMIWDRCKIMFKQINPSIRITNCSNMDNSVFLACEGSFIGNNNSSVTLSF